MAESAPSTPEIVAINLSREEFVSAEFASYFRDPTQGINPIYWYATAILLLENVVARDALGTLSSEFTLVKACENNSAAANSKNAPNYTVRCSSFSAEYYENGKIKVYGYTQKIGTITMCSIRRGSIRNVSPHSGIEAMYKALHN